MTEEESTPKGRRAAMEEATQVTVLMQQHPRLGAAYPQASGEEGRTRTK